MDNSMRGLGSFLQAFGAKFHMPSGGENAKDLIPLLLAQSKSQNQEDVLAGKKSLQAQKDNSANGRNRVTTAAGMYRDFYASNQDEYDSGDPKRIAAADNKFNNMMTAWYTGKLHTLPTADADTNTTPAKSNPVKDYLSGVFKPKAPTTGKITQKSTGITISAMNDAKLNPDKYAQPDPNAGANYGIITK
jgi:hypothetical protein